LEHEVSGEPCGIALHSLHQNLGFHAVQRSKIVRQHHATPAQQNDQALHGSYGRESFRGHARAAISAMK
jgi:hypothetical protein